MIPQNLINSYALGPANEKNGQFKDGDFVANFPGCDREGRSCSVEQQAYLARLDSMGH